MLRYLFILAAGTLFLAQSAPPADNRPPIPPSSTSRTAPTPDPALQDLTTYMERAGKLKNDDIEGRLILSRWARDRRMYSQASEMAEQVLYRDPGNRAAYLILQQIDEARPLDEERLLEDKLKDEMLKRFKRPFSTRNTKHFLVVYDTTDAFAAQRGVAMEKAYDAFQFYFNMSTLRPQFLERRLIMILLKDREDYLTYGKQTENSDFSWSAGYYSQSTNRSIFFDDASGPSASSYNKQAADLKTKVDTLTAQISAATSQGQTGLVNTLSVERGRINETLFYLSNRASQNSQLQNNATTMHEASHQISFNMAIQSRGVDYPFWFSEGLACSFEFEDSQGRRGPALVNFSRIPPIKEAIKDDQLTPLAQMVATDPKASSENKSLGLAYAQSWALFHYLYKFNRDGMEKYIMLYRSHAPFRRIGPDERKVIFTAAFGNDLDALNKKYTDYLRLLPGRPN